MPKKELHSGLLVPFTGMEDKIIVYCRKRKIPLKYMALNDCSYYS